MEPAVSGVLNSQVRADSLPIPWTVRARPTRAPTGEVMVRVEGEDGSLLAVHAAGPR